MARSGRRSISSLVVALNLLACCGGRGAWGACSAIPPAGRSFPSDVGRVDRALAEAGARVTVRLWPKCPSDAGSPGFDTATLANNSVTLEFDALTKVSASVLAVPSKQELTFVMPDTTALNAPDGYAGPVSIVVENPAGVPLAQIKTLYEPSDGCDKVQDALTVFQRFIALPKPNDFSGQVIADKRLLLTIDERDNVLIPLLHGLLPPQIPPTALVERGEPKIKASSASSAPKLTKALAQGTGTFATDDPYKLVRTFTIEGRPLPPVGQVDGKGSLFGTADATTSVLRIASRDANGTAIHNLHYLAANPHDPLLLENSTLKKFKIETCPPAVLTGLRWASGLVAYPRSESLEKQDLNGDGVQDDLVPQVLNRVNAGTECGKSTGVAVTEILTPAYSGPLLEAEGAFLALIGKDDDPKADKLLRLYNEKAVEQTKPPKVVADTAPVVGGRSLAVSLPSTFFRAPGCAGGTPCLRVIDVTTGKPGVLETPAVRAAVAGGRALAVTPETAVGTSLNPPDVDLTDDVAQRYDGALVSLQRAVTAEAISPNAIGLAVSEAGEGSILNSDGDTNDSVLAVMTATASPPPINVGVAADAVQASGAELVFTTPEAAEPANGKQCVAAAGGCDLNGDGDAGDRVLRVADASGALLFDSPGHPRIGRAVDDFVVGGRLVAFRVNEAQQNQILNGDGKMDESVMMVYDLDNHLLFNTGQAASPCTTPGWEWMHPYAVRGTNVFFLTKEAEQEIDLTFDGDTNDVVLQIFNIRSLKASTLPVPSSILTGPAVVADGVPIAFFDPPGSAEATTTPLVAQVARSTVEGAEGAQLVAVGDKDADGSFDPFDLCVEERNDSQFDDDLDGLGDPDGEQHGCDPTYCTDYLPPAPSPPPATTPACRDATAAAALNYVERRAAAIRLCLAHGQSAPRTQCLGYVVAGTEVLPQQPNAAAALESARNLLLERIHASCGDTDETVRFARHVVNAHAEAVNAAAHVAYGERPTAIGACQKAVGKASFGYLSEVLREMYGCFASGSTNCLGQLRDVVTLPRARHAASATQVAEAIGSRCTDDAVDQLDACGPTVEATARCTTCVGWRRAVDAAQSIYGPSS